MAVNKVVLGNETLIDLTEDSVTPDNLTEGVTAHSADGSKILGTMKTFDNSYNSLNDKPKINNTEVSGDKTLLDFGLKDSVIEFTQSTSRDNILNTDSIIVILGKISKWFSDLKSVAFSTPVNNLLATVSGSALDATQGKILNDKIEAIPNIIYSTTEPTTVEENTIVMVYEE